MTKHTQGPWAIEADHDKARRHPLHDNRHVTAPSGIVCDLRDQPAQAADARLIAAAPELLKVARVAAENAAIVTDLLLTPSAATPEEMVNVITSLGKLARAAITKAEEGEEQALKAASLRELRDVLARDEAFEAEEG
jgi:hypothetical protein